SYVQLAVDPRGDAIAAWTRYRRGFGGGPPTFVQAAFKRTGGRWPRAVTLERDNGADAVQVAIGARGERRPSGTRRMGCDRRRRRRAGRGGPLSRSRLPRREAIRCDSDSTRAAMRSQSGGSLASQRSLATYRRQWHRLRARGSRPSALVA